MKPKTSFLTRNLNVLKAQLKKEEQINYEAKQKLIYFGQYIDDLLKNGIDSPQNFISFFKSKGVKLTNNKDIIDYIQNELDLKNKIPKRQNVKGNKVFKDIILTSLSLTYPEKMKNIMYNFILKNCVVDDEKAIKNNICDKIDDILKKSRKNHELEIPQIFEYMNEIDDSNDGEFLDDSDVFEYYYFNFD